MNQNYFLLCLSLCLLHFASAQTIRTSVAAPLTQLLVYNKSESNALAFTANPATLASVQNFSAALFSERKFMLKQLSSYQAAVAFLSPLGAVGICGSFAGSAVYNEIETGLAYAKKLGDKVDVGVRFNYYAVHISSYGTAGAINGDVGIVVHLADDFRTGLHVYNPTSVSIGKEGAEKLPSIYSFGFGYDVSDVLFFSASFEKIEGEPLGLITGVQYQFDKKLFASAGLSSSPGIYFAGFGVQLNKLKLTATASVHPQLGISPGLFLLFTKNGKSE